MGSADWRQLALGFSAKVFALREALNVVSQRYFEGNPLLLDEDQEGLDWQADVWGRLVGLF
ncbi:MAG: hypothetical protein AAB393_15725, partial [Bacteroidota bacterium]